MVGMWEAYKLLFTNYINFSGKSSRAEYWWVYLVNLMIEVLLFILSLIVFTALTKDATGILIGFIIGYLLASMYGLIILIPSVALATRRYRDAGVSPWWLLILSLAAIILAVLSNISNIFYYMAVFISIISLVITILPSKQ